MVTKLDCFTGKVLFDCFGRNQRSLLRRGDKTIKTSAGQVDSLA